MATRMDEALNAGFFIFHTSWIAFNCIAWSWKRTRRWHLVTMALTAISWFGLGIWYGWGYCPCTDWHWQVRARLGYHDPPSYTQLLIKEVTDVDLTPTWADGLTVVVFAAAAVVSIVLNLRDLRRRNSGTRRSSAS